MTGPRIGPSSAGRLTRDIIFPRLRGPAGIDQEGLQDGQHQATANALQHPEGDEDLDVPGQAREHRPDRERARAPIQVCLAPKRSMAQPLTGTTIASAST